MSCNWANIKFPKLFFCERLQYYWMIEVATISQHTVFSRILYHGSITEFWLLRRLLKILKVLFYTAMEVNSNDTSTPSSSSDSHTVRDLLILWYMSVGDPLFETLQCDLCGIVFKIELCKNNLYCYLCSMPILFDQNIGYI